MLKTENNMNTTNDKDIAPKNVPNHLGLILDGNRRWAKERGLRPFEGHRRGYFRLKKVALAAFDRGVNYVSAYVFSTENWKRSPEEVAYLMDLLHWVAKHEVVSLHKKGIRVMFIGTDTGLDPKIIKTIHESEAKTAANTKGTLVLCLNYGGQQEMADAAASLIRAGVKAEDVTPDLLAKHMYAPMLPPVDLVIRTSGEQRLSGFMLWSAAYAEMKFIVKNWPSFTVADLDVALADYSKRERRFGANSISS
jgi:undecaprenyl diphosphate synthase